MLSSMVDWENLKMPPKPKPSSKVATILKQNIIWQELPRGDRKLRHDMLNSVLAKVEVATVDAAMNAAIGIRFFEPSQRHSWLLDATSCFSSLVSSTQTKRSK
jgi:hypothetical protein